MLTTFSHIWVSFSDGAQCVVCCVDQIDILYGEEPRKEALKMPLSSLANSKVSN